MASGTVVPTRRLDDAECRELLADPAVRELYEARGGTDDPRARARRFPQLPLRVESRDAACRRHADPRPGTGAARRRARTEGRHTVQRPVPRPRTGLHRRAQLRAARTRRRHLAALRSVRAHFPVAPAGQSVVWPGARSDSDHPPRRAGARGSLPLEQALAAPAPGVLHAGLHADVAGRQAQAGRPFDLPEEVDERSGEGSLHSGSYAQRPAPHPEAG